MAKPPAKKGNGPSGHKRFGASNSEQRLKCPGAPAMIEALPPHERARSDTIWSKRGTAAHAVGEMVLISYQKQRQHATVPEDYLGQLVEGVVIDQEIVDGVEVYVDWAKKIIDTADVVEIERSGSLYDFITNVQSETGKFLALNGNEYGGTGDFVAVQLFGKLRVGDYKNGRGYVEHKSNSQMSIYALDAYMAYGVEYDVDEVEMTIIQPNGPGDKVRSWSTTPEELLKWAMEVLLPAEELVLEAIKALASGMDRYEFAAKYLRADLEGHCHFCPAKARCQAACDVTADHALLEFQTSFDEDGMEVDNTGLILPDPAYITPEQEELLLQNAEGIIDFIKAVQQRAHARAERGERVHGYKLVEKGGTRRKLISADEDVKADCKRLGLVPHDYMDAPSLKSPAQLEKAFKAKSVNPKDVKAFMDKHVGKNESSVILVKDSDPRPAIAPAIEHEFADLFDTQEDLLEL